VAVKGALQFRLPAVGVKVRRAARAAINLLTFLGARPRRNPDAVRVVVAKAFDSENLQAGSAGRAGEAVDFLSDDEAVGV
jgi:hypothetical protein